MDTDTYEDGIDKAKKSTDEYSKKLKSLGESASNVASKINDTLATAAKVGAVAITAAAAGVAALTKSAISEYADYEQLVGGVDTLFKDSSKKVQDYAANAYKTAGLSANEYMETVTSFSASLLQSLDGDTEAAADKADMAITDMSDNANKMGTDMASIQNAYQGFAKQNYTMLDNLKLGYGGTKEEMERLLRDADELSDEFDLLSDENGELVYSYGDIVDAIHIVQTNMGITGTTAAEASSTIQGSVNSVKGAWHNLLVGLSDGNQDLDELIDQFVDSIFTAADNILPRISTTLDGILKLVNTVASKILPTVIQEISQKLPDLIETGAEIIFALADGITNNLDAILDSCVKVILKLVPKIAKAFSDLVPKIAKAAKKIIKELDGTVEIVGGLYGAFKSLTHGNWIGVGLGLVTAAFGALRKASEKSKQETYDAITKLTKAEKKLIEAGEEAAEMMDAAYEARDDNIGAIAIETKKTEDLWRELQTLVDKNGKVIDGEEDRAKYILDELNEALGTEYEMNGNIIGQYQQMQTEVGNLIKMGYAKKLIDNSEDAYYASLENRDSLLASANTAKGAVDNAYEDLAYWEEQKAYWYGVWSEDNSNNWAAVKHGEADKQIEIAKGVIKQAEKEYAKSKAAADEAVQFISEYEQATSAFASGLYEDTVAILTKDTVYRWEHIRDISTISEEELSQLEKTLFAQQSAVDFAREQYLKGAEGYTRDMVKGMEKELASLAKLWEEATGEAYDAGRNVTGGFAEGIADTIQRVQSAAHGVANTAIKTIKEVSQIASPSKVTKRFGGYLAEGLAVGMEDKTETVARSAADMIKAVIKPIDTASVDIDVGGPARGATAAAASYDPAYNISITVHADTDDLGSRIARELQEILNKTLSARGTLYKNGRTNYAY